MKKMFLFLFVIVTYFVQGQVGIGTTFPEAALDITSTNDGILIPRVALTITTSALPLTAPTVSELVYNTANVADVTPGYYYWDGSKWVRFSVTADSNSNWSLLGNTGTNPATNFLGTTDGQDLVFRTANLERIRNFFGTGNTSFGSNSDANNARVNIVGNTPTSLNALYVTEANLISGASTTYAINANNTSISTTGDTYGISSTNNSTSTSGVTYGAFITNTATSTGTKFGLRVENRNQGATAAGNLRYGISNRIDGSTANVVHKALYNFLGTVGANTSATYYGVDNDLDTSNFMVRTAGSRTIGIRNSISHNTSSLGTVYGVFNELGYSNGVKYGIMNRVNNSGTANEVYGVYNDMYGGVTGTQVSYGVYNSMSTNSNSALYGTYSNITGTGTGNKYGSYNTILSTTAGTHYGVYSDVLSGTGYSGYFLGRFAIGTAAGNAYIMPASRGTDGQIMVTDGAGNVTWSSSNTVKNHFNHTTASIYNITANDYVIRVSNSATGVNLPNAVGNTGKIYIVIGEFGIVSKPFTTSGGNIIDDTTGF